MPTHTLTIELSEEAFTLLQQHLDSGEYNSPTDFMEEAIRDSSLPDGSLPPRCNSSHSEWLDAEAEAAFDAFAANPAEVYTPHQVRVHLAEQRRCVSASE